MKKIYISILGLLLIISACNEDEFLREDARDAIYADNLFENYSGFFSSLNPVYSMMRSSKGNGETRARDQLWVMNTDNVSTRTADINTFIGIASSYVELEDVYNWLYQLINTTNMIINRAEGDVDWQGRTEEENTANKNSVIAQARVARSWAYRMLIYAFGPVPLSVEEITGVNYSNAWERNSIAEIKEQMRLDLEFGVDNLPLKGADMTRINGAVARHYLGELYLSLGEFQKAVDVLKPLCESTEYSLVTTRFGQTKFNEDGNYFMDMIRNPYASDGNTETFFVFANGVDLPGSGVLQLMESWGAEYRKFSKIEETAEWYSRFGGFTKGRYNMTPWGTCNESLYNMYKRNIDPSQNIIDLWMWENTDGRDNFLYEMGDIRGQNESMRRYYVWDWNGNGTVTDPSTYPLDQTVLTGDEIYNDDLNQGDTMYTYFTYRTDNLGYPNWNNKHAYPYPRKWEADESSVLDWDIKGDTYQDVGYLRVAESYLLYAEAYMMLGNSTEAAKWINTVRERSEASTITADEVTLDFILDERARELIGEEERRITLLRTGRYLERVRMYNPCSMYYVEDFHKIYPFPASAIDANKDNPLDQNYGYGGNTTVDYSPPGYPDEGVNP